MSPLVEAQLRSMAVLGNANLSPSDVDTMDAPSKKQYTRIKGSGHQHGLERIRFIAVEPSEA